MADRDFDPKKPQAYLMIVNEFYDKLTYYGFDRNEIKVLSMIIRLTWGFKRSRHVIRFRDIKKKTRLGDSSVIYARAKLIARNVLHTKPTPKGIQYKINSKFSTWIDEKDIPQEAYRKRKSHQPVDAKLHHPGDAKSHQPGDANHITPVMQPHHPGDVTPIKENIERNTLNTQGKNVCVFDPKTNDFKTTNDQDEIANSVIGYLNQLAGKNFGLSDKNREPILNILTKGYSVQDCFRVCLNKWEDETFKNTYFRPSTLFNSDYFEGYLNDNGHKFKPQSKRDRVRYNNAKVLFERMQNERQQREQC